MIRVALMLGVLLAPACGRAGQVFDGAALVFAGRLDGSAVSRLSVQYRGRIGVLDTLARDCLSQMTGSETIAELAPAVAFLELYFNAGRYLDRPVLHLREKAMRRLLAAELPAKHSTDLQRARRLPPVCLLNQEAAGILLATGRADLRDFRRAADCPSLRVVLTRLGERRAFRVSVDRLSVRLSTFMAVGVLRLVPGEGPEWLLAEQVLAPQAGTTAVRQGAPKAGPAAETFIALRDAWRRRDAEGVNKLVAALADRQRVRPGGPCATCGALGSIELLYNRMHKFTVAWVGFAAAGVLLIISCASPRRRLRGPAMTAFVLSTLVLLTGFVLRWVLSGRPWYLPPILNMFEAVVASALLGSMGAIVLELFRPRGYFALAAALYSTIALVLAFFMPGRMGAGIGAAHGILSSPIMAAHVSVIIVGHALVGMTVIISLAYLLAAVRRGLGAGPGAPSSSADLAGPAGRSALAAIDRCNLIVAQLACWTVIMGTMLGAVWGDFAWGRWWGWDPKETWAFITALVYVAVLHLRFLVPARSRGLVTAIACIVGGAAMLFNWIGVNYFLAGKHSYA